MRQVGRRTGVIVVSIALMLTTMVGMSHRFAFAAPGWVDLGAYALPDGTLPWLCVLDRDELPGHASPATACEFCLLAATPFQTAVPPGVAMPETVTHLRCALPPRAPAAVAPPLALRPEPRAPPAA